jgi:hypothetical protein
MNFPARSLALTAAMLAAAPAQAVYLSLDGQGQALVYPYYTVQSAGGNAFNTYMSIVNHASDAKAIRVRLRESRDGRAVASLNVYLGQDDVWTAVLVPDGAGARLLTRDASCTEPLLPAQDGVSSLSITTLDGIERTREGYIEVLEMATLGPLMRMATAHTESGMPANCAAVQQTITEPMGPPSGGLSGTLTLINVADGSDFSVNADALSELALRPYHRAANDSYPGFAAAEVEPVSVVNAGGVIYRSLWPTGLHAVAGAYMRSEALAEYALDEVTRSMTDVVLTFPTRAYQLTDMLPGAIPPFTRAGFWEPGCGVTPNGDPVLDRRGSGEIFQARFANRNQSNADSALGSFPELPNPHPRICAAAAVIPVGYMPTDSIASLTGSISRGLSAGALAVSRNFQNGWVHLRPARNYSDEVVPFLDSLPGSTRTDIATGQVTAGAHTYTGLPMTGFVMRTLRNGTLSCAAGTCQGNYGAAFPLRYGRNVQP